MKNSLFLKLGVLISIIGLSTQSTTAQCNGGNITVTKSAITCASNQATMKLKNHSVGVGVTYTWEYSNSGGVSFIPIAGSSGKDTQDFNVGIVGRIYRCKVVCPTGTAYSTWFNYNYISRDIQVNKVYCSPTGTTDSVLLKLNPSVTNSIDSLSAKYITWEKSTTNGTIWDTLSVHNDSLKTNFTPSIIQYRAYVSICPLIKPYPTAPNPQVVNQISIGLQDISLAVTTKDCVNDTATLSLLNIDNTLKNFIKITWLVSNTPVGGYTTMAGSDTFKKVKVTNQNKYYKAILKLCPASKDSIETQVYSLIVKLKNFQAKYDCTNEIVKIDYNSRDTIRKSVFTYWTLSQNDSVSHTIFPVPIDSVEYSFLLNNKTNHYYKLYSKFCPSSVNFLDSTYNLHVFLNIDSGNLKVNLHTCPSDSVALKLNNFSAKSNFTLYSYWMNKREGSTEYSQIAITPSTDTTAQFRMFPGWTSYIKATSLCPDKYAKKVVSSVGMTLLPNKVTNDTFTCTSVIPLRVKNDTARVVDYTGTSYRSTPPVSYQWLSSINKITYVVIASATSSTYGVPQADKNKFFKRITKNCTGTLGDTTDFAYFSFPKPNAKNGRTEFLTEVCPDKLVEISVVDTIMFAGQSLTYQWQVSYDGFNWENIESADANSVKITTRVSNIFKYYRRLTFWCNSGIVDSSKLLPVFADNPIPWCETFDNMLLFGSNILYTCWNVASPVCNTYVPNYGTGPIWSRPGQGRTGVALAHQTPPNAGPVNKTADTRLITPAFDLKRGKIYRFSFWHKEAAGDNPADRCWDSLYVTWGKTSTACEISNKFGDHIEKFSYDQWNKFWADFLPPDDGFYYFAINYRNAENNKEDIFIDDVCIKEIDSCNKSFVAPVTGQMTAPSKTNDRSEDPSKSPTYDKNNVTHRYCIGDTIMLTYNANNYTTNFDFYGMKYQFYSKRLDKDWKIDDTFFKPVKPVPGAWDCHVTQRTDFHVMNIVVDDTNKWYKIVATCEFNNKTYHTDSLLVNGTHSVPYCEDWESVGNIQNPMSGMPSQNTGQITGAVPAFQWCPTCWSAFSANNNAANFFSITLPFRNPNFAVPQLDPDGGFLGNNAVINGELGSVVTKKVLVMPAMRFYKNRGYRISFRWTDNRKSFQSPYGNVAQSSDSLYVVLSKGVPSGTSYDSFANANKKIPTVETNIKSNILDVGTNKYKTYWGDFTVKDTGTYYVGIVHVAGAGNVNPYRFYMDYFCLDTLPIDDCNKKPEFIDPLRVRISPDGKSWYPGQTSVTRGEQWCVGNEVCLELDFAFNPDNSWSYGWKHIWERNRIDPSTGNPAVWVPVDTTNSICYVLGYKYENYRLRLVNSCGTKDTIIGPFGVSAPGGNLPWCEKFDASNLMPSCWDLINTQRINLRTAANYFGQGAKSPDNYLEVDYASPSIASNPYLYLNPPPTVIPPGFGLSGGVKYRFSFWYKDNGISQPIDSIKLGWSYNRPTATFPNGNVLINTVKGDIVKSSSHKDWKYYSSEFTPAVDSGYHFKLSSYNPITQKLYYLLYDDFCLKQKYVTDALVIAIDSPDCKCGLTANTSVKVTVMNIGSSTLANIPVSISVDNGTAVNAIVPGPIVSNEKKTIVINNVDLSQPGNRFVKAWTNVPGDQDPSDDAFDRIIIHNELYNKPIDTGDSVCIYSNLRYAVNTPNKLANWYVNQNDLKPFQIGDTMKIDSFSRDTCFYASASTGTYCNTSPENYTYGTPLYASTSNGLTFHNISKDTLLIENVTVYSNNAGPAFTGTISLSRYGVNNPNGNMPVSFQLANTGKNVIDLNWKIPPGTDYNMVYNGNIILAYLNRYIFFSNGCFLGIDITGPSTATNPTRYNYFYNWKVTKPGCESERVKVCFTSKKAPEFKLKDTNRVCSAPVYQVCGPNPIGGDSYTYAWNKLGSTNKCVDAKSSGYYTVTVTNQFNCSKADSFNLTVDPSPDYNLGNDTSFCRNSPYTIATKLNPASNVVTWNNGMSGTSIDVLNPGTYISTAFNTTNFCEKRDTVVLTRKELPPFSLGNDRVFCGTAGNVGNLLSTANMSYIWNGGSPTTATNVVTSSGTYWVTGTDNTTKCSKVDTIVATLRPFPIVDLGRDTVVCGSSYILKAPVGKFYYLWNTTSTKPSILVANTGKYFVTVTDTVYGCSAKDSVNVTFKTFNSIQFDLGPDTSLCGTNLTLNSPITTGVTSYSWKGPDGVITTASSKVADKSGVYSLTLSNGCYSFTDSIKVNLKTQAELALDLLPPSARGCGQISLQATSSPGTSILNWGNQVPNPTSNIVTITQSGTYSVSLQNSCGSFTKSCNVIIDKSPTANFSVVYPTCNSVGLTNLSGNAISYLWNFGDGTTSTDENILKTYTQYGSYVVTLLVTNSCGSAYKSIPILKRDCDSLNGGGSSSIAIVGLDKANIILFPNPTKDKTKLYGVGVVNGDYTISLRNLLGQTIIEKSEKIVNHKLDVEFSTQHLANGDYVIQITNDSETIVRKLVVNK